MTQTRFTLVSLLFGLKFEVSFFFHPFFFPLFWQRIEKTERFNSKMKARRTVKKRKNCKMKKYHYSMRVSATIVMPAQNCLVLAQNKTECEKTDSIREFQRQGRSLFFSKWVEGDIVSHLEYHLIVVCSNRSDNLSLHIAHFRIPPWRRGHKHTAAPTSNYVTIGANDKSKVFCPLFLSFLKQPCRKMAWKILFKTNESILPLLYKQIKADVETFNFCSTSWQQQMILVKWAFSVMSCPFMT